MDHICRLLYLNARGNCITDPLLESKCTFDPVFHILHIWPRFSNPKPPSDPISQLHQVKKDLRIQKKEKKNGTIGKRLSYPPFLSSLAVPVASFLRIQFVRQGEELANHNPRRGLGAARGRTTPPATRGSSSSAWVPLRGARVVSAARASRSDTGVQPLLRRRALAWRMCGCYCMLLGANWAAVACCWERTGDVACCCSVWAIRWHRLHMRAKQYC